MFVDEKQYNDMLRELVSIVHRDYNYVVGVKRGGLWVSKPLSSMLQLPHKEVTVSFYKGTTRRTKPHYDLKSIEDIDNLLICDDLIDSGDTLRFIKSYYPQKKISFACLFYSLDAIIRPDYFIRLKPNEWVDFFWEKEINKEYEHTF